MLSYYFSTIGFYISSMLVVMTVYSFLYGILYLLLSGMEKTIMTYAARRGNNALQTDMASQSVVQLGLLTSLPMIMEIGLERGFRTALGDTTIMQLQLASVFFTFSLGTKVHYYGRTILHGRAKYRATGRGFVVQHERFGENYRMYSRSHFTKDLELMILLIIYSIYGSAADGRMFIKAIPINPETYIKTSTRLFHINTPTYIKASTTHQSSINKATDKHLYLSSEDNHIIHYPKPTLVFDTVA
ncbi:putative 1,3-beta-glucan synthase [Rosa chinensis]|uniref:Putative 1,3-beta-glucan synthase n=1 Tax=Rosa chinensis TaxID=74649 RepID=A0A2P6PG83_ROSCH|nr:putative 1,3-beta-glucan synthase [Rosa chinensis]